MAEPGLANLFPRRDGLAEMNIPPELLAQLAPLWMRSAGQGTNQATEPMARALLDYESRSPAEIAAMRTANSVRPIAGRAGEGPSIRNIFDMTPVGAMVNAGAAAAPALSAAIDLPAAAVSQIGREETGLGQARKKQQQNESNVGARTAAAAAGADDRRSIMAEQKILAARGLYTGAIDGNAGADTLAARAEAARLDAEAATKAAADSARAGADTATAQANAKAAEAALEKSRLDAANIDLQKKGSDINAKLESEVGPFQQVLRDYGPLAGYVAGAGGGYGGKKLVNYASNKLSERAATKAEALMADLPSGTGKAANLDKATAVNEFWRKGGAGEAVPFRMTPQQAPGFVANEMAAPTSGLYAPKTARNATIDTIAPVAGAGESAYFQFVGAPNAHEELRQAYAAADKAPTDANLRRVQAAKDSVAIAEFMTNAGRGFAGTYGTKVFTSPRNPTQPSMKEAELTRGQVEDWLRAQAASSARKSQAPAAVQTGDQSALPGLAQMQFPPAKAPSRAPRSRPSASESRPVFEDARGVLRYADDGTPVPPPIKGSASLLQCEPRKPGGARRQR
jgi:hypothetical protein